jgi:hypothetical protein
VAAWLVRILVMEFPFPGKKHPDLYPGANPTTSEFKTTKLAREFFQFVQNAFVFKTHYIGYWWRCKLLQRCRCNSLLQY